MIISVLPSPVYGRRWPDEIRSDEGIMKHINFLILK